MNIGVLTGGGDCPGLNAAVRGITRAASLSGWTVTGIRDGWRGAIEHEGFPLTIENTDGILDVGGTILGSSRTNPLRTAESYARAQSAFDEMGLDALVAIGGDDTLSVAAALASDGHPIVGIPKTIDNDVPATDACIGFDTAVETIASSVAHLRTTTMSHHRVTLVETMGREAGWLAALGGLASGSDFIGVPEKQINIEDVIAHVHRRYDGGANFSVVVIAEGTEVAGLDLKNAAVQASDEFGHVILSTRSIAEVVAHKIEKITGKESRACVLGHLQRGGTPTTFDRVLGTRFGFAAVDLLAANKHGQMTALIGLDIKPIPLVDIGGKSRTLDESYLKLLPPFV